MHPLPLRFLRKAGLRILVILSIGFVAPSALRAETVAVTKDTVLTQDFYGSIVVAKDNVSINCNGYSVVGNGSGRGIIIGGRRGVTVRNCNVSNFATGFWVSGSTGNTFEDNSSFGNTLANENQPAGWIDGAGFWIQSSPANVFRRNRIHDNPSDGFDLFNSPSNAFFDNVIYANHGAGVFSDKLSFSLNFSENQSDQNGFGYLITGGDTHVFSGNTAIGNVYDGFHFISTHQSSIRGNSATGNSYGFVIFDDSTSNTIEDNSACGNVEVDLVVDATSTNNLFSGNAFCTTVGL